jgi:hypothetical protein
VSHAHQLRLQIVSFESIEGRVAFDGLVEVAAEVLLDFAGSLEVLGSDEGEFDPLWEDEVVCHPIGVVIYAFSSLLRSFWCFLQRQPLAHDSLQHVVVQIYAQYLPPKSDFPRLVLFSHCCKMTVNQRNFFPLQRVASPL